MNDDTQPIGEDRGSTATDSPPPHPTPHPTTGDGPRVSGAQARDLTRLRRSATDRRLAGVCGGLARHLDVDPTLVRVLMVVLVLFGGAGLLLYAALWLVVPDETTGRASIQLADGTRSVVLIVVAVVAALTALGQGWGGPVGLGGWWFVSPVPLVLLGVVAVVWLSRRGRTTTGSERRPVPGPVPGPVAGPVSGSGPTRVLPAYTPPRPRTGPILFWPTLAVVAIALGALGLYDASGGGVSDGAYSALALAITGAALVLGAFWGRPGGLVLLALLSIASTALGVVLGTTPSEQQLRPSPTAAAQVRPSYEIGNGTVSLDLTRVADLQALDGRQIDLTARSGVIEVILPKGVGARVDADIDLAGAIGLPPDESALGFAPHLAGSVPAAAGSPTVDLDLDSRLGAIYVRSQS